jgi:hypothetical protein
LSLFDSGSHVQKWLADGFTLLQVVIVRLMSAMEVVMVVVRAGQLGMLDKESSFT